MTATKSPATFETIQFQALGTTVLAYSQAAEALAGPLRDLVAAYEGRLSRFRPDSEVSRLSRSAGREVRVSGDVFELLVLSMAFWRETNGIFDPLILRELEAAGYDRTFSALPRVRADITVPPQASRPAFGSVALYPARRGVCLPDGARLDLGGIAKGWIIDRLGGYLAPHGPFLVDVGGDMAARGAGVDGEPGWLISVASPFRTDHDVCWLRLEDAAIATSTTMRRRWVRGDRWLHHLIDPRTGGPAGTDLAQVTVVAPTAVAADVHAKVALVLGRAAGLQWLLDRSLPGLLVASSGDIVRTPHWERFEVPVGAE
jgi:thiamine biosynthesis lipoprotein